MNIEKIPLIWPIVLIILVIVGYLLVLEYVPYFNRKKKIREHKNHIKYLLSLGDKSEADIFDINSKCRAIYNLASQNKSIKNIRFAIENSSDTEFKKNAQEQLDVLIKKRAAMYAKSSVTRMTDW